MSEKKSSTAYENMNLKKYNGPPYSFDVWINGKKTRMSGFDVAHIYAQLGNKKPTKIIKVKD